jgi:DnaJ-class molecular chaperone
VKKSLSDEGKMLPENSIRRLCDQLGIPFPPRNEDEIKQAYKKTVLKHHPDKGGTPESFRTIQNARTILLGYMQEMQQQKREQEEKARLCGNYAAHHQESFAAPG